MLIANPARHAVHCQQLADRDRNLLLECQARAHVDATFPLCTERGALFTRNGLLQLRKEDTRNSQAHKTGWPSPKAKQASCSHTELHARSQVTVLTFLSTPPALHLPLRTAKLLLPH